MKVYLVDSTPHGDYCDLIGIFSTRQKAEEAKERWLKDNNTFRMLGAFEPNITEIELDKYIAYFQPK